MAELCPKIIDLAITDEAETPYPATPTVSSQPSINDDNSPPTAQHLRHFGFLDFPYEIRQKIYEIIGESVDKPSSDAKHLSSKKKEWARGRKSFLLTCRQVNDEFTPHFFQSTRICLEYSGKRTPAEFAKFLASMSPHKALKIRHLEYRICAFDQYGRILEIPDGLFFGRRTSPEAERMWMVKLKSQLPALRRYLCLETLEIVRHLHADFLHDTEPDWEAEPFPVFDWLNFQKFHFEIGTKWFDLEWELWRYLMHSSEVVRQRSIDGSGVRLFYTKPEPKLRREVDEAKRARSM